MFFFGLIFSVANLVVAHAINDLQFNVYRLPPRLAIAPSHYNSIQIPMR